MKNILNKLTICILLVLLAQVKIYAQAGVLPAPYCLPGFWAIPCNQPNPPNTPGNFINDFVDSFNTTGGIVNIVNNNSTCNTQTFPGLGQQNYFTGVVSTFYKLFRELLLPVTFAPVPPGRMVLRCL